MARTSVKSKPARSKAFQKGIASAAEVIDWNRKHPGQPSMYHEEFCHIVEVLTLVGGILIDVAEMLGTNPNTVDEWMRVHSQFSTSIKNARMKADAKVEKALYQRACGYEHPEEKIFCTKDGEVIRARTTARYPPDTAANFIWLQNRRGADWKHRAADGAGGPTPDDAKRLLREEMAKIEEATDAQPDSKS